MPWQKTAHHAISVPCLTTTCLGFPVRSVHTRIFTLTSSFPSQFIRSINNIRIGVCRSTNGTVKCEPGFPNAFDISATVFKDITASNASSTSTEQYQQSISKTSINNSLVRSLSSAVGALLILSLMIGFSVIPLSLFLESAFSKILLVFFVFDACALFSSLCMFYSIFTNEVAGAYAAAPEVDQNNWQVSFGVGAWFLPIAFLCRLLCS